MIKPTFNPAPTLREMWLVGNLPSVSLAPAVHRLAGQFCDGIASLMAKGVVSTVGAASWQLL